jgi:hypothetical protein
MSQTTFIIYRNRDFGAFDVIAAVFLKHLVDVAAPLAATHGPWLAEAVDRWRVNTALVSSFGMHLDEKWSETQVDIVVGLVETTCKVLGERQAIPSSEVENWELKDGMRIFARGLHEVPTGPVIEFGSAVVSLLRGTLPECPDRSKWYCGIEGRTTFAELKAKAIEAVRQGGQRWYYERFTDDARNVFRAANQEAMRVGHEYIGTDDVLIGIALSNDAIVADVLSRHGITVSKLRECLRDLPRIENPAIVRNPRAKVVVENAMTRVRDLYHLELNPAHLLLGVLDCSPSDGCRALAEVGANIEQMKLDILGQLLPGSPAEVARRHELEQRLEDHPDVVSLKQQIEKLQSEKESAVANRNFESAASALRQQDSLRRALLELYKKLAQG